MPVKHNCSFVSGIHDVSGFGQIGRLNGLFAVVDECLNVLKCLITLFPDSLCEGTIGQTDLSPTEMVLVGCIHIRDWSSMWWRRFT